jgi:putative effector of murein hydrolase
MEFYPDRIFKIIKYATDYLICLLGTTVYFQKYYGSISKTKILAILLNSLVAIFALPLIKKKFNFLQDETISYSITFFVGYFSYAINNMLFKTAKSISKKKIKDFWSDIDD